MECSVKIKYFIIFFSLLILAGCKSTEYNEENAADKAREFIFENIGNVSPENTLKIKYTFPRILTKELFLSRGQEYNQYYFAWDLQNPKITVMVFGTGHKHFQDWKPIRIVFKEFDEDDYGEELEVSSEVWADKPTLFDDQTLIGEGSRGAQ